MEDWLKEAKEKAKEEAQDFVDSMYYVADKNDIDREWFLEEVVNNIHKIKNKHNRNRR